MAIFSTAIQKTSSRYSLKVEQLAFADLVALGWSVPDAWNMTIRDGLAWNKDALKKEQEKMLNSEPVQLRIKDTKLKFAGLDKKKGAKTSTVFDAASKENILEGLLRALNAAPEGSREWLQINQQIISVQQLQKEKEIKEDDSIRFYLPQKT